LKIGENGLKYWNIKKKEITDWKLLVKISGNIYKITKNKRGKHLENVFKKKINYFW